MTSRLYYNPARQPRAISRSVAKIVSWTVVFLLACTCRAAASSDAPQWMHALVGVRLPSYDEKTDAVLLHSETNVTVVSTDKVRTHVREAYRILRPNGREHGTVWVHFNPQIKIISLMAGAFRHKAKTTRSKTGTLSTCPRPISRAVSWLVT